MRASLLGEEGGGGVTDCVHLQNRQHTEGLEEHCDVDRIHGLRG